ncbi:MAG: hypothetical protein HOG05_15250, partial [Bacteroidetes bacterium]|nr:hypothetical protein [Bacteroidota bacterium]
DAVRQSPDLKQRIIGYITFAGVIQGTSIARKGLDDLDLFLKGQTIGELVKKLENKQA